MGTRYEMGLLNLLFGGALVIGALLRLTKRENALVVVLLLFGGIAVAATGVLDLMGFIDSQWVDVSRDAVVGIWLIWTSVWALYSPPSPSFPRWAQWAMLVIGVGGVLSTAWATVRVLLY